MQVLWWSGLVILGLGIVRSVIVVFWGVANGSTATIVINLVLLVAEAMFVAVLWRVRDQLRSPP